jgi:uncharacterized membrane protein (DUF373 family)
MAFGRHEGAQETEMKPSSRVHRVITAFELLIVVAAGLLVVLAVAVTTGVLYVLFANGVLTNVLTMGSVDDVQRAIQRVFAGVLLLLLGLELLETLKTYFTDYRFRTEVILVVAMIAVGRHVIQIDFEHVSGVTLLGIAALTLSLAASFVLVRMTPRRSGSAEQPASD